MFSDKMKAVLFSFQSNYFCLRHTEYLVMITKGMNSCNIEHNDCLVLPGKFNASGRQQQRRQVYPIASRQANMSSS